MTAMILSSSSCISKKNGKNCEIKEILKVTAENNGLNYYMHIKFSHCTSKELRETLVKNELMNRFPLTRNRTIYVEEYLGKMYNEYKYEIKVE
jgi:hypothetical protein